MGSRRRYSREFKIEAVRMVTQLGHPVSEVAGIWVLAAAC